jgi:hypothetical protein
MGETGQSTPAGTSGPVSGKLNEFQRTMLQWSGLHPYNAVHVARITAVIELGGFARAAAHVLVEAGLTNYVVRDKGGVYRYEGGRVEVVPLVLEGGDDPVAVVHREMERQLNEPFPSDGLFQPFRWFLVKGEGETFVGLSYFHVVADAESIGRLLREVITAAIDEVPQPLRDGSLSERRSSRVPTGGPLGLLRRTAASYGKFQRMRQSFRSPDCPVNRFDNEWFGRSLDADETTAVLALAKRHGATVNDLCLAAVLQAVIPAAMWRFEKKRQHLSAGCVVNLRRDLPESRRRDFGLFLGSFSVTHPVPVTVRLDELITSVHAQTEEVKRAKLYLASRLEFRMNRFLFARQPLEKQRNFYRKAYPVWGSITNFKMDGFQIGEKARVADYYRAVSAGPALPFVIGVTGFDGRLQFGFTYRPDVIQGEIVRGIADRFLQILTGKEPVA